MTIIVALGDSTTAGTPLFKSPVEAPPRGEGDETSQFAYWLMQAHPEWDVRNRGVNGERSDQIAARWDRDVAADSPAAVIIIAGVNDVYQGRPAEHVTGQLRAMYDRAEAAGIPASRIMLLGFSQGACLSLEFSARNARRYGGIACLSGGLIGPDGTPRDYDGSYAGTPAFLGCSDVDGHVPASRVVESSRVLERMGAAVTMKLYPGMGHMVNDDEIEHVRAMMEEVLSASQE